ncbi:mcfN [Symbiodinium sp. CCMP2456]|nr:mcfN [Symbiodinium sp. CCMP2456]
MPRSRSMERVEAVPLVPEAINAAKEVHQTSKASNEKSWLRRAAEEADLVLEEGDEDLDRGRKAAKPAPSKALWGLFQQLQERVRRAPRQSGAHSSSVGQRAFCLSQTLRFGTMSTYNWAKYDPKYYLNGTRIQLDPVKYQGGLLSVGRQVVAEEGAGVLATGLGPTAAGYFVQGWFKFGGNEFFKIQFTKSLGDQKAWDMRTPIMLGASACAEFIADIFLCPLEAARIRQVSDPTFPKGTFTAMQALIQREGIMGWYAGLVPILFKQIPYTMAKFAVQGTAEISIYNSLPTKRENLSRGSKMGVSMTSGFIAGVAAAIISHPADSLLSKINKKGAGGDGSMISRLGNIAKETGFVKLCTTGLGPRCVMIGTLTAGQFLIFDTLMPIMGVEKFHFHDPSKPH